MKSVQFSQKLEDEEFLKEALTNVKGVLRDLPKIDLAVDRLSKKPPRIFKKGEYIFREGDRYTDWYVISTGKVRLWTSNKRRKRVELGPGECFGELAIIYNCRRPANAIALRDSAIFSITGKVFKDLFLKPSPQVAQFIKVAPLFKLMKYEDRRLLSQQLSVVRYKPEDVITRQGDVPKAMFVVYEGEVERVNDVRGSNLCKLVKGQHFGARPYSLRKRHHFTAIASKGGTTVLRFDFPEMNSRSAMEFMDILTRIPGVQTEETVEPALPKEKEEDIKVVEIHTLEETKKYVSWKPKKPKVLISKRDEEEEVRLNEKFTRRKENTSENLENFEFAKFEVVGQLGKGSSGTVQLVYDPKKDETYARKTIAKKSLEDSKRELLRVLWEKEVMTRLDSQFIVRLHASHEDKDNIYLFMDAVLGGEMFNLLQEHVSFREKPDALFYAGCVCSAIEHMHSRKVVYRDLKPENLLIDMKGYLKLCDLGFAKVIHDRSFTMLGTAEYLAPEMFGKRGHDRAVDWWTFGVFVYEIVTGDTPFWDDDPEVEKNNIINAKWEPRLDSSDELIDLLTKLFEVDPERRLGMSKKSGEGVADHPWFKSLDWRKLYKGSLKPPVMPKVRNNRDVSNFKIENSEDMNDQMI